jgi:hypothetical protein
MDTQRARKTTVLARKLRLRRRFARAGAALQAEVARIAADLEAEADARLQARLEAEAGARLQARLEAEVFGALEAAGEAWNARKITTFSGGVRVGERPPEVFRGVYVLEMRETAAKGE